MTATEREPIEDLIERSSLGTPGAKAMRARTSDEQVRKVLDRVAQLDAERGTDEQPDFIPGDIPADPISLDDFGGGSCRNPHCICAQPSHWPVCGQWEGINETGEFCPCCGWTKRCHPDPPALSAVFCAAEMPFSDGVLCRLLASDCRAGDGIGLHSWDGQNAWAGPTSEGATDGP